MRKRSSFWPGLRPTLRLLVVVLAASGLGAACAQESYDSRRTVSDLVDAGLARDVATCVVREMNRTFKVERLGAREEPGDDERADMVAIYEGCVAQPDG